MPRGFFHKSQVVSEKPVGTVPKCGACGLYKTCKSPKMEPTGDGEKKILIIAEAPGKDEDAQGIQLVGDSGKELQRVLRKAGVDMRRDCVLTNSLICRPPNNRTPTAKELDYCRPNLVNTIKSVQPKVIIPIGQAAVSSLLSYTWKASAGSISRWVGWTIPDQSLNAWICPTWHPSYLLHSARGEFRRTGNPVLNRQFAAHLQAAASLHARPHNDVPDYKRHVLRVYDGTDAARLVRRFAQMDTPAAFDYETNRVKPDWPDAEIVSCSISNGTSTIAYPWTPQTAKATSEFLKSPCPKIASNAKFEERWTLAKLGHRVRNWAWDTMTTAHSLDNRPGITGLKFQSYVLLGQPPYDEHLHTLLKGKNGINLIGTEIDLDQLLTYNGLDSLLEWHVAQIQRSMFDGKAN